MRIVSTTLAIVLVALVLAAKDSPAAAPALAQGNTQGDVNCDGSANSIDALQVLRSVAGLSTSADCLHDAGDVDCDSAMNAVDALRILRYVADLPNASPGGCVPIGESLVIGPSSIDLIEAALEAGSIDQEAALKYEVFALYADSRLPPQYWGDDRRPVEGLDILAQALESYSSFSPDTQEVLAPFFKRPDEPGSWLTLGTVGGASFASGGGPVVTWQKFPAVGGKVQVWAQDRYPGDAAKAQALADAMSDKIWPELTDLMQKEPVNDDGLPNNGGSAALDIYFIHAPLDAEGNKKFLGRANYADKGSTCQELPSYLYVDSNEPIGSETSPGILQTTAHEFFHTLQFAYKYQTGCWSPEYRWFVEASATWAEHFVYPNAQSEQVYAEDFLNHPDQTITRRGGNHEYGAYLLPFYLQLHEPGGAAVVQRIFAAFGGATSLNAIDGQVQGGIDQTWPRFAVQNWNRTPADEYKQVDSLSDGASSTSVYFGSPGNEELAVGLDPLSAYYSDFTFADAVRTVVFDNKWTGIPDFHVWGIAKIGTEWKQPEDWTEKDKKVWCRNNPDENLTELVIIVSNSDLQSSITPSEDAVVEGRGVGCTAWEGAVHADVHFASGLRLQTSQGFVHFEPEDPQPHPGEAVYNDLARIANVTWTASGSGNGCTYSGQVQITDSVGHGNGQTLGWMNVYFNGDQPATYAGVAGGPPEGNQTFTMKCNGDPPQPFMVDDGFLFFFTGFPDNQPEVGGSPEAPVISGSWSGPACNAPGACTGDFTWDLQPAPPDQVSNLPARTWQVRPGGR